MCGFSGVVVPHPAQLDDLRHSRFLEIADRLKHRGDTETQQVQDPHFWLCHHRLAFQDLKHGKQPMWSANRSHVILFNGEVYNHLDLRHTKPKLREFAFQTRSDTETLLAGYLLYGTSFFESLDGEYAFVILGNSGSEIVAHRDPSGVKPLFFASDSLNTDSFAVHKPEHSISADRLSFASETKGLYHQRSWHLEGLKRQFVGLYEPIRTPFSGVIQVPPGAVLQLHKQSDDSFSGRLKHNTDPVRQSSAGAGAMATAPFEVVVQEFLDSLRQSVQDRLLSDVELGVYLSGGVDSRTIAALLAREQSPSFSRKAFTVGFSHTSFDETQAALGFAKNMGFSSHLLRMTPEALAYSYPLAVQHSENVQPYTNGAAKWWLSRLTREHVKGVLTGDGADELLCGYPSYKYVKWWMHAMRARRNDLTALRKNPLGSLLRDTLYTEVFSNQSKDPWAAGASSQGTGLDFIDSISAWGVPHPLFGQISAIATLIMGKEGIPWLEAQRESVSSWFSAGLPEQDLSDPRSALLLWQNYFFRTHLPVQVLNWVGDRMEMAHILEGRTPFLSAKMRRLVRNFPDRALLNGFTDKHVLRRAMPQIMPADFAHQPKKQFGAPFLQTNDLLARFSVQEALEQSGLGTRGTLTQIQKSWGQLSQSPNSKKRPSLSASFSDTSAFERDHLNQCTQTLISMGIVHRSLVQEDWLERNPDFERSVLEQQEVVNP